MDIELSAKRPASTIGQYETWAYIRCLTQTSNVIA